jgi:hypothetical protein
MDYGGLSRIIVGYPGLWIIVDDHGLSWIVGYHGLSSMIVDYHR